MDNQGNRTSASSTPQLGDSSSEQQQQAAAIGMLVFAYKYAFSWLVPFQYVVGCAGTGLCIVVLLRSHSTQREVRPWFIALSLLDICVLSIGLPLMYTNIVQVLLALLGQRGSDGLPDLDPRNWNAVCCYGILTMQLYSLLASSWVQVGISLLRCLSAVLPLASRFRINPRSSRRALAATLTVSMVAVLCVVLGTLEFAGVKEDGDPNRPGGQGNSTSRPNPQHHKWSCEPKSSSGYYFYSTIVLRVFLPAICLLVSTSVILYSLHRFKRAFHAGTGRRRSTQQRRLSLILIGMNCSFLLFALPYELLLIYNYPASRPHHQQHQQQQQPPQQRTPRQMAALKIVERVFAILMYTNNATNWVFYFALGKRFRQELRRRIMCCGQRRRQHRRCYHQQLMLIGASGQAKAQHQHLLQHHQPKQHHYEQSPAEPDDAESPIAEVRHCHSVDSAKKHANHRVCHVNFKLSSV